VLPIEIHALRPSPDCRKHWLTRSHVKVYLVKCLNTDAWLLTCSVFLLNGEVTYALKKAFIMSENNGPVGELKYM